jgi:DNA-directed RNA polymerase specialized sigma24 family protein
MKKIKTKQGFAQPYNDDINALEFIKKSIELSLRSRGAYSWDICEELSAQMALDIFKFMEKNDIREQSHFIRTCAKNLVINHLSRSNSRYEVATDPIDMPLLDKRVEETPLDNLIRDEYLSIHTRQLAFIESAIGANDYKMLEAHFRDGESYQAIATRLGCEVHKVANHINRARKKCTKLRDEGHISY